MGEAKRGQGIEDAPCHGRAISFMEAVFGATVSGGSQKSRNRTNKPGPLSEAGLALALMGCFIQADC